jgi:hypothetical protein
MKIIDFELPKTFTIYTSDGKNRTANIKSVIDWDSNADHPCWSSYMNFDVGFFGLPYGNAVNTTRIVYDPTITIYHVVAKPSTTWIYIMVPLFAAIATIAFIIIYITKIKKPYENKQEL